MPRLPAKQREAEKVFTPLAGGGYAASANDVPARLTWNVHAVALLSNLNGDRRKRKQALHKFINSLSSKREEFRKEKKTGAGVTSEAIEFYQYVLRVNMTWKGKGGRKKRSHLIGSFSSHDESDTGKDHLVGKDFGRDDDSVGGSSIGEEEFFKHHNDLCEVCATGGEVLCCATCSLVFHIQCARPSLKVMPADTWSCAYCDAAGVTGLKKDSRQRKRACQALREMEKMRAESKASLKGKALMRDALAANGKGTNEIREATSTRKMRDEQVIVTDSYGCRKENMIEVKSKPMEIEAMKKRSLDDIIETDVLPAFSDSIQPRVRRQRRQPTIFNPQSGAAKFWQSDGVSEWRYLVKGEYDPERHTEYNCNVELPICIDKEKSVPEEKGSNGHQNITSKDQLPLELVQKLTFKSQENVKHVPYHCKYCMDDESTQTCCFCACRVCFSKHEKQNTILCDMCDSEYHIFCLSPPLKSIPTDDWFCPMCCQVIAEAQRTKENGRTTKSLQATKRGRPKGSGRKSKEKQVDISTLPLAQQPRTPTGRFASKGITSENPKRGPGRPPKKLSPTRAFMKRGRVLPSASTKSSLSTSYSFTNAYANTSFVDSKASDKLANVSIVTTESNRGTNSDLSIKVMAAASSQSKHSLPPEVNRVSKKMPSELDDSSGVGLFVQKPMFSSSGMLPSFKNQRSRSGRMVKRNTVYDETTDGIHHMKSTIQSSEEIFKGFNSSPEDSDADKHMNEVAADLQSKCAQQRQGINGDKVMISAEEIQKAKAAAIEVLAGKNKMSPSGPKIAPPKTLTSSSSKLEMSTLPLVLKFPSPEAIIVPEQITPKEPIVEKIQQPISTVCTTASPLLDSRKTIDQEVITPTTITNNSSVTLPAPTIPGTDNTSIPAKVPRRKPGARECMQISRRFGVNIIPQHYMDTLKDYCSRGKVEHLIRMRERLDDHSRYLESQMAGLESILAEEDKK